MPVEDVERERFRGLVRRRLAGEPVAYILGRRDFLDWTFEVTPEVLVPRPETEALVLAAQRCLEGATAERPRALELGVGSGCVVVSLALLASEARFDAVDVSAGAIAVARRNATRQGVADRITWHCGDLWAPLPPDAAWDVIVSNPPYVTTEEFADLEVDVRDYEPRAALVSGADPLAFHRRIVEEAARRLTERGAVLLELPGRGAEDLAALCRTRLPGRARAVEVDLAGDPRVFMAAPEVPTGASWRRLA